MLEIGLMTFNAADISPYLVTDVGEKSPLCIESMTEDNKLVTQVPQTDWKEKSSPCRRLGIEMRLIDKISATSFLPSITISTPPVFR